MKFSSHAVQPQELEDPFREWLFWGAIFEVQIPAHFFPDRQFMGLYKLDERAVWVFDVAEATGGIAHIKRVFAVNGKVIPMVLALLLQLIHPFYIEAEMDKPQIAPVTVAKYLLGIPVQRLNEFYFAGAKQLTKGSPARLAVAKQHSAVALVSA